MRWPNLEFYLCIDQNVQDAVISKNVKYIPGVSFLDIPIFDVTNFRFGKSVFFMH